MGWEPTKHGRVGHAMARHRRHQEASDTIHGSLVWIETTTGSWACATEELMAVVKSAGADPGFEAEIRWADGSRLYYPEVATENMTATVCMAWVERMAQIGRLPW